MSIYNLVPILSTGTGSATSKFDLLSNSQSHRYDDDGDDYGDNDGENYDN